MTPWAVDAEVRDGLVRLSVQLSTDPGPMRAFAEFLSVELDEAHATMLLGQLQLALRDLQQRPVVTSEPNVRLAPLSPASVSALSRLILALPPRPENDR